MGERKGTNHYYPPDYDPKVGSLNKFLGTHALRERARKIHMGILIIRFEMPYNIWCDGCGNHIGMGVRYNAEKKKVGMYFSTPVYQFRMKCHLCDNHFDIKTDPANLDYVIVSGARRQENRWDPTENEQVVPETKEVSRRLYDDAMFKLEHGIEDKKVAKSRDTTLESALVLNEAAWKDDYSSNCALRSEFRARKMESQTRKSLEDKILKKNSINIDLVNEHPDDIKLAQLLMDTKTKEKKIHPLKRLVNVIRSKSKIGKKTHSNNSHMLRKNVKIASSIHSFTSSSSSSIKKDAQSQNTTLVSYANTSSDSD
ncbi:coiled-coil domain-containing protein 130 homolog [Prorops nasuta]|uniref:coiled-coil domain-containing protein 130 homolog n=1 Tax=Prorops nasuta TaxID=863751 RepID=UPI0034CF0296